MKQCLPAGGGAQRSWATLTAGWGPSASRGGPPTALIYFYYGCNKNKLPPTVNSRRANFNYDYTNGLNPYYLTGFTDGEGCFYVGVSPNPRHKTGYRVKAVFHIGVHIRDIALLKQIQLFFRVARDAAAGGSGHGDPCPPFAKQMAGHPIGTISKLGAESVQFRVYGFENLKVIMDHFDKYPLLTNKQSDYLLFKQIVNDMEKGKHLTVEGLNKIMSIKAVMNNREISDKLNLAFPNIEPVLRPDIKNRKIKSLYWLAGFTDAEGCFFIALKKSLDSKLGETV